MNPDMFDEIKKAEKDANRTLEKAERQKAEIILDMGKNARLFEEKELDKLKKEMEAELRQFEERSERERERFFGERKGEMEKVRKDAGRKVEKAVESLKKEFRVFLGE